MKVNDILNSVQYILYEYYCNVTGATSILKRYRIFILEGISEFNSRQPGLAK